MCESPNPTPTPIRCPGCQMPLGHSPFEEDRALTEPGTCQACQSFEAHMQEQLKGYYPGSRLEQDLHNQREDLRSYRRYWYSRERAYAETEVPKRLQKVTWSDVAAEVRAAIPDRVVDAARDGRLSGQGFGLLGGIGVGKSGALAALIPNLVSRIAWRRSASGDALQVHEKSLRVLWVDWPMTYSDLQRKALDSTFTEKLRSEMIGVGLLILDDLGREGLGRATEDGSTSFGHRILNDVITARNGDCKPTWWTSNVELKGLFALYDGSAMSRLLQDNPPNRVAKEARNRRLPS